MSVALERVSPGEWEVVQRNTDITSQHLRPPMPNARVFQSAGQVIATGAASTQATFDSEHWDVGELHSTSANTGRLTAPIAGLYHVAARVRWPSNATGYRFALVRKLGTTVIGSSSHPAVNGAVTDQTPGGVYRFAAAEWADVGIAQTSGGNLTAEVEFWMVRLGGYENEGVA